MLVVSVERNRFIQQRQGQTHAEAVLPSQAPQPGRLTHLYKSWQVHDPDGHVTGKGRERGSTITVLRVEPPVDVPLIGLDVAIACGYRGCQDFRDTWQAQHPRSPLVQVVWFVLGDWRDRDLFMNFTGTAGGDYTRNARRALDSDAPVLTREEIDALSAVNRQKDEGRRAQQSAARRQVPLSQRLEGLLIGGKRDPEKKKATVHEIKIITDRIKRGENKTRRSQDEV